MSYLDGPAPLEPEQFLIRTEGGPHPGTRVATDGEPFGRPLPDELPAGEGDGAGVYRKVSQSDQRERPPSGRVLRGAHYRWVPAESLLADHDVEAELRRLKARLAEQGVAWPQGERSVG